MGHRRFDPIQPTAKVEFARDGEGGAGDLLSIKAVWTDKRAVLVWRQSSGEGLREELVSEAREVVKVAFIMGRGGDVVERLVVVLLHEQVFMASGVM